MEWTEIQDSKTSAVPTTSTAINPAVLAAYSAYSMQVPMAQVRFLKLFVEIREIDSRYTVVVDVPGGTVRPA